MSEVQIIFQEDEVFDDIDDILNIQNSTDHDNQIKYLKQKLQQYEMICKNLAHSNQDLQQKIQYYQEQYEQKTLSEPSASEIFHEEYSTMQFDFNDIEEMLKEYKNDLNNYKNTINGSLAQKNVAIKNLKEENSDLKIKNEELKQKMTYLQEQNKQLQNHKNNLLIDLQYLQINKKSKNQTPRNKYKNKNDNTNNNTNYQNSSNYQTQRNFYFNDNIQNQLQKLIQKLIKELEYQKNIRKKVNEEIKRLQADIVGLEKEITFKNHKIYNLELNALKKHKNQVYTHVKTEIQKNNRKHEVKVPEDARTSVRERVQSKIYESKRSFSLMQLINGYIDLNNKEKHIIALKLIKLYEKKIKDEDFTFLILASISIYNYHPHNLNLLSIRITKTEEDEEIQQQYEKSEIQSIWNLGFLLDNLFNKTADNEQDFGTYPQQNYLNQFLNEILENKDINNLNTVHQLQKIIKDAIKARS